VLQLWRPCKQRLSSHSAGPIQVRQGASGEDRRALGMLLKMGCPAVTSHIPGSLRLCSPSKLAFRVCHAEGSQSPDPGTHSPGAPPMPGNGILANPAQQRWQEHNTWGGWQCVEASTGLQGFSLKKLPWDSRVQHCSESHGHCCYYAGAHTGVSSRPHWDFGACISWSLEWRGPSLTGR
jgi:hypothetical protein